LGKSQREMRHTFQLYRVGSMVRATAAAALATILLGAGWVHLGEAANQVGGSGHEVLVGRDDDNVNNPDIQPPSVPSPPGPNQSLNNTDLQVGGRGNDILIGLGGNHVQIGDDGDDIFIGGVGADVQFGGRGNDVSIWAPGDGSEAFIGGPGRDALVIGLFDRDPANAALPLLARTRAAECGALWHLMLPTK